jgi:hypothetical protein
MIYAQGLLLLLLSHCRKADELEFLAPRLFAMAHALGLNLTVKLFCTGKGLISGIVFISCFACNLQEAVGG